MVLAATALALLTVAATSEKRVVHRSTVRPLDSKVLARLFKERGFVPGPNFKALVIEIVPDERGGFVYHPFDYKGTSKDRDDWWPASAVKIFAAVAALEKIKGMGFSPNAELTFEYEDGPVTVPLKRLVQQAITPSNNAAFDRLVELVGFDDLNGSFLSRKNGLRHTVLLRAYTYRYKDPATGRGSNLISSRITVSEGGQHKVIPARQGKPRSNCPEQGNCTTLRDLSETLRRVMMHEELPEHQRFKLGKKELQVLRDALEKEREQEGGVAITLRELLQGRAFRIFHKAGYSYRWYSENLFLRILDTDEQWIITMANYPGRDALNEAARHIGELILSGRISEERAKLEGKPYVKKIPRPMPAVDGGLAPADAGAPPPAPASTSPAPGSDAGPGREAPVSASSLAPISSAQPPR